jgi:hypothetical protein
MTFPLVALKLREGRAGIEAELNTA